MFKFAVFVCVFIPAVFSQCNIKIAQRYFKRSVYEFSTDMIKRVSEENDHHFIISPLSLWNMLTIMSIGASDVTRVEMKKVLGLHNSLCFNRKYLEIARIISSPTTPDVFLERSSVIFSDASIEIKNKFEKEVLNSGVSNIKKVDFQNVDEVAVIMNDYVKLKTHESIDEVVIPEDLEDTVLMITDALFFKGLWQIPFDANYTTVSNFFNEKGKPIGEVNLMMLMDNFKMNEIELLEAYVLELPYGDGKNYSMLIFLPSINVSLNSVIEKLKLINIASIKNILENTEKDSVKVGLPRFKLTSDLNDLKELLIDMGLTTMFDKSADRFPSISNVPLWLSNVVQKAKIEVTEDGSKATYLPEFSSKMEAAEFIAVKPFLFMIIDKTYEIPLFTGAYSKPSLV